MDQAVAALGVPSWRTDVTGEQVGISPHPTLFYAKKQLTLQAPTPQGLPASAPCIPCLFPGRSSITVPF